MAGIPLFSHSRDEQFQGYILGMPGSTQVAERLTHSGSRLAVAWCLDLANEVVVVTQTMDSYMNAGSTVSRVWSSWSDAGSAQPILST